MTWWKQEILDRIGLPNASEELFNKAWDESPELKAGLTQLDIGAADRRFQQKLIDIATSEKLLNILPLTPLPMTPEEWRGLYTRFHNCAWKFFLDHPNDKSTEQDVKEYCENYHPWAAKAVLYGYDPYKFVSPELGGVLRSKADWRECIAYLDKYTGFVLEGNKAVAAFRGPYAVFSNFSPAEVEYDGLKFPTVENAFQAAKSLTSLGRQEFVNVSPSSAKKMGRRVRLRPDWDEVKVGIMRSLLLQKFCFGSRNLYTLQQTGSAHITEGNTWHDNFWGACTCQSCKSMEKHNMMGKLLMEIRDYALAERAIAEGEQDRYAYILPIWWEDTLEKRDDLRTDIIRSQYVDGILVKHENEATLFHCCTKEQAKSILAQGFKVKEEETGAGTFGDDVVYAWPDTSLGLRTPDSIWLAVTVRSYMRSVVTVDKDGANQHECIFFPSDVLRITPI